MNRRRRCSQNVFSIMKGETEEIGEVPFQENSSPLPYYVPGYSPDTDFTQIAAQLVVARREEAGLQIRTSVITAEPQLNFRARLVSSKKADSTMCLSHPHFLNFINV